MLTPDKTPVTHLRMRGSMEGTDRNVDHPPVPEPLPVTVFDNHAHMEIADGENPLDYRQHLDLASSVGVGGVIQVGTTVDTSTWSAEIASREPRVLAAVALHPNEAPDLVASGQFDDAMAEIEKLAAVPRVVAIGETGLDYFRTGEDGQDAQRHSFVEHIRLAKKYNLALQIHDRDAHDDVVKILLQEGAPARTVFHCYSGDEDLAEILNKNGWYASFAGTVTFSNAHAIRRALQTIDRSLMLVETDTPFLTPTPFRGQPNSPYTIPYIVRSMADQLDMNLPLLCSQLASNTHDVYGEWDDYPLALHIHPVTGQVWVVDPGDSPDDN
jgi:TatD DNase family protein